MLIRSARSHCGYYLPSPLLVILTVILSLGPIARLVNSQGIDNHKDSSINDDHQELHPQQDQQQPDLIPPNDHEQYHYFAIQLHPSIIQTDDLHSSNPIADYHIPIDQIQDHNDRVSYLNRRSAIMHRRAQDIATDLGVHLLGRVGELHDHYQIAVPKSGGPYHLDLIERVLEDLQRGRNPDGVDTAPVAPSADHIKDYLLSHPDILLAELQIPRVRLFRRGYLEDSDINRIIGDFPNVPPLIAREGAVEPTDEQKKSFNSRLVAKQGDIHPKIKQAQQDFDIHDPLFAHQWHLINTVSSQAGNDINVTGVWHQGIYGNNVKVCLIDDGIDYEHREIKENFWAEGSYDFNDHVALPTPRTPEDRHGTRCAGEIAGLKNDVCGIGIAFHAKVSGVRILSGPLTEVDEAAAINYRMDENQIYSCSWGPSDNGAAMEGPPRIVSAAVKNGILHGRHGLGSIFVFASGNGGAMGDNCNYDGYTNSIYTVTVSSIDRENNHPLYSELCSANMVVTYSSATQRAQDSITTSDWQLGQQPGSNLCTSSHGGTSAAAPLVSGIYALVLSVRPTLNWRDFQHLTVETAIPVSLSDDSWQKATGKLMYSHKFGFGKISAYEIVELAKTWKSVDPQVVLQSPFIVVNKTIPQSKTEDVRASFAVSQDMVSGIQMKRLEHVTVTVTITHHRRGDVIVDLISPHGIVSHLGVNRPNDNNVNGFQNWTFMSVAHWNEDPVGEWKVVVKDPDNPSKTGVFESFYITFWGEGPPAAAEATPPAQSTTATADDGKAGVPSSTSTLTFGTEPTTTATTSVSLSSSVVPQNDTEGPSVPIPTPTPIPKQSNAVPITFVIFFLVIAAAGLAYFQRDRIIQVLRNRMFAKAFGTTTGGGGGGGGNSFSLKPLGGAGSSRRGIGSNRRGASLPSHLRGATGVSSGANSGDALEDGHDFEDDDDFEFDEDELRELEKGGYLDAVDNDIDDLVFSENSGANLRSGRGGESSGGNGNGSAAVLSDKGR